jgi:hypothetical protein
MTNTKRLPAFEKFIQDVRTAWAELPDTEKRMKRVKVLLEGLVNDSTMKEHSKHWPSTEGHKNLLLYELIAGLIALRTARSRRSCRAHRAATRDSDNVSPIAPLMYFLFYRVAVASTYGRSGTGCSS